MVSVSQYKKLLKPKHKQPEGVQQVRFGSFLKSAKLKDNVIFYTYSGAGEKKPMTTAINQKRKGLRRGDLDYRFEIVDNNKLRLVYIEFKSSKGSLTPEQKIFFERHKDLDNATCYIAKSAEEGVEILKMEKLLKLDQENNQQLQHLAM